MNQIAREVIPINIEDEMKRSYLGYAVSMIIARALPDVRDGLKPVQRRILMAMHDLNLTPNAHYRKSAKIAGDTSGNYHPHGEQIIYPTMVRMAQDFNARYPLIDGQGNMGSIDGDPPAAMRYTEMRMSPFAVEMLEDLDKDTVDWQPNYDQTREEPMVLPGKFPNLLCNGSAGIAVGMATNIPPHNLREVIDATIWLIDHPECTVGDLMQHIKGPDFPTAGLILGTRGIRAAYETGRGQVTMQAEVTIEQHETGKSQIVITELPYQVNKKKLIEDIAELVKAKKVDGITALDDFSDRTGMRVVIELRRDTHPKKVLNYLLKHTQLRTNFGVIMLALVDGTPRVLNLKQIIQLYVDHRREIVVRRTRYELEKAKSRAHILEGLRIALQFLDEIIKIIRESRTTEIARTTMMSRFGLSQVQAEAILNMLLRQLTGLEREKIENEYREVLKQIAYLEDILANPQRVFEIIKQELRVLKDKYGDDRRTRIIPVEAEEIGEEDTIPEEETIVTITRGGYIKRVPADTYRSQRRPGRGVIAANTKEKDILEHVFVATTHHYILFFTDKGRVYRLKAYEVPQGSRQAMGTAIINLIQIEPGEAITATVPVRELEGEGYLVMATKNGEVKRTAISEFHYLRANGLRAFDLEEGDELRWVKLTTGKDHIIMVTRKGMAIRFPETQLRVASRASGGVRGISLQEGDYVVGMDVVKDDSELLVVSEKGLGKRTPLKLYKHQTRGGKGLITMAITPKGGEVVSAHVVTGEDNVFILTAKGIGIHIRLSEVRCCGRSTQGVKLINLEKGDWVSSVAVIARKDEDEEDNGKG
ncbi:MAG: DNA gyrase subunit A [Armatimonadetes bacterium]|nr:DNA gyrase subunit A [Armatimonadota bacterium]